MLGRKDYTPDELDHARSTIRVQLDAYKKLGALATATDPVAEAALQEFEPIFFNNLTLVLDRFFVDRLRLVTGKDTNPLNEVEMMCDSLMNNDGMLRGNSVIAYLADLSVLRIKLGERIRITEPDFERLSAAFFAEVEKRFVTA
jgi:hypothetical protein